MMKKLNDSKIKHYSNLHLTTQLSLDIVAMATEVKQSRIDISELKEEIEEYQFFVDRLVQILTEAANEIHNGPLKNGLHSFHDIPQLIKKELDISHRLATVLTIQHLDNTYDLALQLGTKEEVLNEFDKHRAETDVK